jgi:hypothetical protein
MKQLIFNNQQWFLRIPYFRKNQAKLFLFPASFSGCSEWLAIHY